MKKKNYVGKIATTFLIFTVLFTSIPLAAGELDAHAASSYIKKLTATSSKTTVTLKWTKLTSAQKKKVSGFVIYRDGKIIKRVSKKKSTYKDTGLQKGRLYKYQVKTYKKKKVKKWYNKKTGKWTKKKPKKKWRGKSKKVTVYKYGNKSPIRKIRTKTSGSSSATTPSTSGGSGSGTSGSSGSGGGSTQTTTPFLVEDATVWYSFSGVKIHLGQKWSSTLYDQLKAKSNGTLKITRVKGIENFNTGKTYDLDLYMFNTNTYSPFLCVYVCNGQIQEWDDNDQTMGMAKGTAITRGKDTTTIGPWPDTRVQRKFPEKEGSDNGIMVCGFSADGDWAFNNDQPINFAHERTIGFHFLNAARVARYGTSAILKRSRYIEGADLKTGANLTWSGTLENGSVVTNQRYGAQAWAETMAAADECTHSNLTVGPLAIPNKDGVRFARKTISAYASDDEINRAIRVLQENAGTGLGEQAIYSYSNSCTHVGTIFGTKFKSAGLGFAESAAGTVYHCEQFSIDEAE